MKLKITERANDWFKKELGVTNGDFVQLYVRYGGFSSYHAGFSLGISMKEPMDPVIMTEKGGITYYVEKNDEWYLNNKNLTVDINEKLNELQFIHE